MIELVLKYFAFSLTQTLLIYVKIFRPSVATKAALMSEAFLVPKPPHTLDDLFHPKLKFEHGADYSSQLCFQKLSINANNISVDILGILNQ